MCYSNKSSAFIKCLKIQLPNICILTDFPLTTVNHNLDCQSFHTKKCAPELALGYKLYSLVKVIVNLKFIAVRWDTGQHRTALWLYRTVYRESLDHVTHTPSNVCILMSHSVMPITNSHFTIYLTSICLLILVYVCKIHWISKLKFTL